MRNDNSLNFMVLEQALRHGDGESESKSASASHPFYTWPRPAALDFEPLYEALKKRQPRAANIHIGVALLRAEQRVRSNVAPEALLDLAEEELLRSFTR